LSAEPPMNGPPRASYEVRVEGILGSEWSAWFDALEITTDGSQSVLSGQLVDDAALHGVLLRIRDLGIQLISVRRLDPGGQSTEGDRQ
jgi:hypothetical protein